MRKTIMIVDDDTDMLKLLGMILSRHGFDIITESCSEHVMESIQKTQPDLFVLDVMMPGLDGFELCRRLRANDATGRTPIIFLSAKVDRHSVHTGIMAGGNSYLAKTALTGELVKTINSLLEKGVPVMVD